MWVILCCNISTSPESLAMNTCCVRTSICVYVHTQANRLKSYYKFNKCIFIPFKNEIHASCRCIAVVNILLRSGCLLGDKARGAPKAAYYTQHHEPILG